MNRFTWSQSLFNWKTEIVSSVVVLVCLLLFVFFPTQGVLQNVSKGLLFLFVLPALYIKIVLKKRLADFGFHLQNPRLALIWNGLMLVASILIISVLFNFFDFANNYLLPAYLATNFWRFLFYELILVNIFLFFNDFFFKGFILFTFAGKFSLLSAILQAMLYVLFMLSVGALDWRIAPAVILSFTGGIATYKSGSFLYTYLINLIFMISLDAYIIHIFK